MHLGVRNLLSMTHAHARPPRVSMSESENLPDFILVRRVAIPVKHVQPCAAG